MSLTLETTRLEIRPWLAKDVDHYLTLANDVGYTAFSLAGQFALTSTEAAERIKDRTDLFESKKIGKFLLFSKTSHELITIDHTRLMVKNLEQSKNWYSKVLGISPWLDTSDYVEFRVGQGGLVFTAHGATTFRGPLNIESDEAICQNCDPFGNIIGLIGKVAE